MLVLKSTKQFKKDLKRASRQGRDVDALQRVLEDLREGRAIDEKYRDHGLIGTWKDHRECHIAPDWLLIYKATDYELRLARLGSHSELFASR